jgi:hypothetical protein
MNVNARGSSPLGSPDRPPIAPPIPLTWGSKTIEQPT